ncbi:MAG: prephenate dehydratase, partial [Patescibacteria group bacterium]|nr:prephenate dehydratase [Patescibacteria group bacterium]
MFIKYQERKEETMKVGYLGPEESFSGEVAVSIFKEEDLIPFSSFELTEALKNSIVQKAVLPIENSLEGPINWVLDLLVNNNQFFIQDEIIWLIEQNLIGFGKISEIKTIYSNPQALAQCAQFLNRLKVKTENTDSTSAAVQLVAKKKNSEIAAIGSKRAAKLYKIPIIKEGINDTPQNWTRFIILGEEQRDITGQDKTSLVFEVENRPGSLCEVLEEFARENINMTMIISRPSKRQLGEYIFFV